MERLSSKFNRLLNFAVRVFPAPHVFREPAFVEPSPLSLSAVPSNEPTYSSLSLSNRTSSSLDQCLYLSFSRAGCLNGTEPRIISAHHISSTRHLGISRDSKESHAVPSFLSSSLFLLYPSSSFHADFFHV